MAESVIQIKSGIMVNIDVTAKNITHVKKIIFGILLHVVANSKCLAIIIDNLMITRDEIIVSDAKSCDEETKTVTTNANEKI